MGIGKVSSLAAASIAKVNSIAKASINKINAVTASFAAAFNDNKSFDLDGANDYLSLNSGSFGGSLETTGSVSMWVKLDSMSANGVMWQITAEEGTDNQLFILWHNASGVIRGNVRLGGTSNLVDSGAGLENDGNYHHVVMTWYSGQKTTSLNRQ